MLPNEALEVLKLAASRRMEEIASIIPDAEPTSKLSFEEEYDEIEQAIETLSPGTKDILVIVPRKAGTPNTGMMRLVAQMRGE